MLAGHEEVPRDFGLRTEIAVTQLMVLESAGDLPREAGITGRNQEK